MISSWVLNFANSIVGVGVLAMPFCFQQCGVVLAGIMVLLSAFLTKSTCEFLLRGASNSRTTSYEQLALHLYGPVGKLITELGTIGLLLGTLVAFQVVIGDLAPSVVHKFLGIEESWSLRTLMMAISCLAMVPLCMMRNISSLSSFNAISMVFYSFFILVIVSLSLGNFISMKWLQEINFWRPAGFFHCLPIILLAFSCQTQVFAMYSALPDPNMMTMTQIINKAVDLVSLIYIVVGSFGYIAFYTVGVKGDLLHSFSHGLLTDGIKTGFWISVIFSYPLMAFPVRAAINSFLFSKPSRKGIPHQVITTASDYISPDKFNYITIGVLSGTLVIGILIPNIETVLAITGALVGTSLCFIYPSALFLKSGASGRLKPFAQIVMICSILTMLASTATVLSGMKNHQPEPLQTPHLQEIKPNIEQPNPLERIISSPIPSAEMKKEPPSIENPSPIQNPVVEVQKIEDLNPKEIPTAAPVVEKVEMKSSDEKNVDIIQPEQTAVNVAETKVKEVKIEAAKPVKPAVVKPAPKVVEHVVAADQHLNTKRNVPGIGDTAAKVDKMIDSVGLHLLNVKSEETNPPPVRKDAPIKQDALETRKESIMIVEEKHVKPVNSKEVVKVESPVEKVQATVNIVKEKPVVASVDKPQVMLENSKDVSKSKDSSDVQKKVVESASVKQVVGEVKMAVPNLQKKIANEDKKDDADGKQNVEKKVEKRDIHATSSEKISSNPEESQVKTVVARKLETNVKSIEKTVSTEGANVPTHAHLQRDILSKVERES